MLEVKTPREVLALIQKEFRPLGLIEEVPLAQTLGRVLAEDVRAEEYVPDFDRSTADGYACRASDTFGSSDAIPAILNVAGQVMMGEGTDFELPRGDCVYVPTGGAIPRGADCAVMIEYTEDYGDGSGTHTKELSLWPEELGITAEAESFRDYTDWYVSANTGMGACLVMAEEMGAYILTDKATFLTFAANDGVTA